MTKSVGTLALALPAGPTTSQSARPVPTAYHITAMRQPRLLVRHLAGPGPSVLFVHGATFPSALSVAYRIDGISWMDDLRQRGFDVWAFDFAGYGESERETSFLHERTDSAAYGGANTAAIQIGRVIAEIRRATGHSRVDILAHSWGTMPAGVFAAEYPSLVRRLVLFGPIGIRSNETPPVPAGNSVLVTRQDQLNSFAAGRPDGLPYTNDGMFEAWMKAYLASDPTSGRRIPPSVRVPSGPGVDLQSAGSGNYPYLPSALCVPTLLVRGDWDVVTTAEDMATLATAMTGVSGGALAATLARGTHRMHLERNRHALFDAVGGFLARPAGEKH